MPITPIRASWMRGGTSKGLFLLAADLPTEPAVRDALLRRALGSPDPYGKQIDGLGGASSSTSKVVVLAPSARDDCDVDYLFGQVPVGDGPIDWSGNCGNLTAAVAPCAIRRGLVTVTRDGPACVRIWQANIGRRIDAHLEMRSGEVVEQGEFMLDGVAFPAAPIRLDFIDPAAGRGAALFPTGRPLDTLPGPPRPLAATLINAGNPMVLIDAAELGVDCAAPPAALDADPDLLARCESLRVAGSLAMGLAASVDEARRRGHTPKLALLAPPLPFESADGRRFGSGQSDLGCRVLSMGRFHHAVPGTAAVALASASRIPGTVAHRLARPATGALRIAHPSGLVEVDAETAQQDGQWHVQRASMVRSARLLMDGTVFVATPEAVASPAGQPSPAIRRAP